MPAVQSVRTIGVYVAEDQNLIRGALVALLSLEDGISVVGETDRGDTIVDDVLRLEPTVAILDIRLPGLDGLSAAAALREKAPQVRVLILTSMGSAGDFRRAVAAGVHGFMVKDAPAYRLAEAVRAVARGERVIDVELADDSPGTEARSAASGDSPLTPRERSVLTAVASGATMGEMRTSLGLSTGTIRNYLSAIISKTSAKDGSDAVRIATHNGWL